MKTLKTIASILLMAVTFLATSCTPDEVENPLAYTLWEYEETTLVSVNDEIFDQRSRYILRFEDDYTGVLFIKDVEPDGSSHTPFVEYFTYTYENNQGFMTFKRQGIIFDEKYTLDPNNETLHYNYSDFHKVKSSTKFILNSIST